jgi:hypothetical protein
MIAKFGHTTAYLCVWQNMLYRLAAKSKEGDLVSLVDTGRNLLKRPCNWRLSLLHFFVVTFLIAKTGLASSVATGGDPLLKGYFNWRRPRLSFDYVVGLPPRRKRHRQVPRSNGAKTGRWNKTKLHHTSQRRKDNTLQPFQYLSTNRLTQQSTTLRGRCNIPTAQNYFLSNVECRRPYDGDKGRKSSCPTGRTRR